MKLPTTCLTALLAASSLSQVAAGPNGASNCVFGGPSVGNTHLSSTNVTNGTLADGGFNVAIGESVASPGMPITVTEGTDLNITVDGGTFRGVLIRIEGTTSDMVTPVDPLRVATNCPDDAAAATHSERSDKTSVSATFSGLPVGSHKVDVDVVVENINDVSTYYYGAVDLTVEEPVVPSPALPATVVDVVVGEPDLSVLVAAVTQAGLVDTLSATTTNYTVFAPVNASLATLDPKFLTDNWKLHLIRILQYHVVGGAAVEKAAITDGQDIPTLAPNEAPLKASTSMGDLFLSGGAFNDSQVVEADLIAGNGVVHKVDQFFLPEILTIDLLSAASNAPQGFEEVAKFLALTSLQDELMADGRTIFTPSDFAFSKPENQYLLPQIEADPSLVDKILSNHLALGVYPAALMLSPDFTELEMLSGQIFPITVGGFGNRRRPVIGGIDVSVADNIAGNGVAHVIDDVLLTGIDFPTLAPSMSAMPVAPPSSAPSVMPSLGPSVTPEPSMSVMPSPGPSASVVPSTEPSMSSKPSVSLSGMPSEEPTAAPSISVMPSPGPSVTPEPSVSMMPSPEPSMTGMPSPEPSMTSMPSPGPSISAMPVSEPSTAPSATSMPSPAPSVSAMPSPAPSVSDMPSDVPSDVPSAVPSDMPSDVPSSVPSDTPSRVPSAITTPVPSSATAATTSLAPIPATTTTAQPSAAVAEEDPTAVPTATDDTSGTMGLSVCTLLSTVVAFMAGVYML